MSEEIHINIRIKKTVNNGEDEPYTSESIEVVKTFKSNGSIYDLIDFITCGINAFEDENPTIEQRFQNLMDNIYEDKHV